MISALKPAARPLGETMIDSGSLELLTESLQKTEIAAERKCELERRLYQTRSFLSHWGRLHETDDSIGESERKANAMDIKIAEEDRVDLEREVGELEEELAAEAERRVQLRQAIADEEERNKKTSVWMVSSLGVPRTGHPAAAGVQGKERVGTPHAAGPADIEAADIGHVDDEFEDEHEEVGQGELPEAQLNNPEGLCVEDGVVYVTDSIRSSIRKISSRGKVQALAGTDVAGHVDGACDQAQFNHPRGVCLLVDVQASSMPTLLVCDTENHCLRVIHEGQVSTVAGCPGEEGHADGSGGDSRFNLPWAACTVQGGRAVLVCDGNNHCVRRVEGLGEGEEVHVSTVFGNPGVPGRGNNELRFPWSICSWRDMALVGDKLNQRLLLIDPTGSNDTAQILSESWPQSVRFGPRGLGVDGTTVYMSHSWQSQIWRLTIDPDVGALRILDRIAGTGLPNHRDGKGEFCEFFCPAGMGVDRSSGMLYVSDHANHCVRRLRELRTEEVQGKLAKFMHDIEYRGVLSCFRTWLKKVDEAVAPEPIDTVLAVAMGTHQRLGCKSAFRILAGSDSGVAVLRRIVVDVGKLLRWRVVHTRGEVVEGGGVVEHDDSEERLVEARKAFDQFDQDGGGTIDVSELLEALSASDMEVSQEEVQAMIEEFDSSHTGEISFRDFCRMQGIELPPQSSSAGDQMLLPLHEGEEDEVGVEGEWEGCAGADVGVVQGEHGTGELALGAGGGDVGDALGLGGGVNEGDVPADTSLDEGEGSAGGQTETGQRGCKDDDAEEEGIASGHGNGGEAVAGHGAEGTSGWTQADEED